MFSARATKICKFHRKFKCQNYSLNFHQVALSPMALYILFCKDVMISVENSPVKTYLHFPNHVTFTRGMGSWYRGNTLRYIDSIYSRLSLSRSRRDPLKRFEISVLRHIRCAELRKIPNEQPNFTHEYVI